MSPHNVNADAVGSTDGISLDSREDDATDTWMIGSELVIIDAAEGTCGFSAKSSPLPKTITLL